MHFNQLYKERVSVREFQPQIVSKAVLHQVLEAARMAPSACNRQPWAFVVITDAGLLQKIKLAYPREWFATVPELVVVCGNHDVSWKRPSDGKDHCDVDVAIAVDHMTLRAAELGLGTCWVCNFDVALVREALDLPPFYEPMVLLPIGYPAEGISMDKKRHASQLVVFENHIHTPFQHNGGETIA